MGFIFFNAKKQRRKGAKRGTCHFFFAPLRLCFFALKKALPLLVIVLLVSCSGHDLSVYNEYLTPQHLASYTVLTPDRRKNAPDVGQRLHIGWDIQKDKLVGKNLKELVVFMRFGNREENTLRVPLQKPFGKITYDLLNDDYFAKEGIKTWRAEVIADGEVVAHWNHQLWTRLITLDNS